MALGSTTISNLIFSPPPPFTPSERCRESSVHSVRRASRKNRCHPFGVDRFTSIWLLASHPSVWLWSIQEKLPQNGTYDNRTTVGKELNSIWNFRYRVSITSSAPCFPSPQAITQIWMPPPQPQPITTWPKRLNWKKPPRKHPSKWKLKLNKFINRIRWTIDKLWTLIDDARYTRNGTELCPEIDQSENMQR